MFRSERKEPRSCRMSCWVEERRATILLYRGSERANWRKGERKLVQLAVEGTQSRSATLLAAPQALFRQRLVSRVAGSTDGSSATELSASFALVQLICPFPSLANRFHLRRARRHVSCMSYIPLDGGPRSIVSTASTESSNCLAHFTPSAEDSLPFSPSERQR